MARILKAIFAEANPDEQRSLYHQTIERISDINKSAGEILENAEGDALTYLDSPKSHWKKIRTNNIQERANRELQRRFKVVQIFPYIAAFERLAGAVVISINESWGQRHYISVVKMLELNDKVKTNKTEEEKKADVEAAKAKLTVIYN